MVNAVSTWLVAAGFLGAGLVNAMASPATQSDFVRWGYPRWWSVLTGGLEIICAALIALPVGRIVGLTLGAVIIAAALRTVLRHRELSHLAPLGVFAVLIALAATAP